MSSDRRSNLHQSSRAVYETLQRHIGPCREWVGDNICGEPPEFVVWGKLTPADGLGPKCYDHAAAHVGHHGVGSRSNYALINLRDLAADLVEERPA